MRHWAVVRNTVPSGNGDFVRLWRLVRRQRWRAAIVLALIGLSAAGASSGSSAKGPPVLTVEAAAGEARSVLAAKCPGEFRLRLLGPSGEEEKNIVWRLPTFLTMSWVAREAGIHSVICEPMGASSTEAFCGLTETRAGSASTIEVEALLRRGYRLLEDWSPGAYGLAEEAFRDALRRSRDHAATEYQTDSLLGLARALELRGKSDEAVPLLEEAVGQTRASSDPRLGLALLQLAQSLVTTGAPDRAENALAEILADERGPVRALVGADVPMALGDLRYLRGQLSEAETLYREALQRYLDFGDLRGIIDARINLGHSLADQNRDDEARSNFEEALGEAQAIEDRQREAMALRALGTLHSNASQDSTAIRYFARAQRLFEQAGDDASMVTLYNGLGALHKRLGDLPVALEYYRKAIEVARRSSASGTSGAGSRYVEGAALLEMGTCLRLLGEHEEAAQSFERARTIFLEMRNSEMLGTALAGLGNVFAERKEFGPAIEDLQAAVSMKLEVGATRLASEFLNDLAMVYLSMARLPEAAETSRRALRYARESGELLQEARALANLSAVSRKEGDLGGARRYLELALDADEVLRLRVPSAELRALSFQNAEERYRAYIELLMELRRQKDDPIAGRLALEAVERSRSRALLDAVRYDRAPSRPGPADKLIERELELRDQVRELALRADLGELVGGGDRSMSELLAELRRVRGLIHSTGPSSADSYDSRTLSANDIEARFAKGRSLLLEYFLGGERSFLWVVGGGRFELYALPSGRVIEEKVKGVYDLVTARQDNASGSALERATRARELDQRFYKDASSLARDLLGPVHDLDAFERIVVVSDGALNYLPISALPHPQRSGEDAATYLPLVVTHEIVRAPSVTVMVEMESRAHSRESIAPIAVVADPVFSSDDPRVDRRRTSGEGAPPESAPGLDTSLRGSGRTVGSLSRLLGSREELVSISGIAPQKPVTVTDFMADRPTAERLLGESYRVVHFATHGILNDEHPELSGIVLSLVDEQGRSQDGFLRVQDIHGLQIDTQLVVLSACETALGHLLRGEGLSGLAMAFLHAGAGSVVASKWKVDDLATRELMEAFYRGLFVDGGNPAAALRAAQISLWKRRRTSAPFYWSAFEVHGVS